MIMQKLHFDYEPIAGIELRQICQDNLPKKFPPCQIEKAKERLNKELAIIEAKEWCAYFRHIAVMIGAAAKKDLSVTHRGAVCGSIVAYLTGITDINPLDHDLTYESFMGPNGEKEPYFEINVADQATIDAMISGLSEIPSINRGHLYTVPVKDGRPGAIVIIPSRSVGKLTPIAEQSLSLTIVDRTVRNEIPDFEQTIREIKPYVMRYTESDISATLQKLQQKTGAAPIRTADEAEKVFKEYLLGREKSSEDQSLSIPMCFSSVVLEKLIDKMNVTSLKELIDAFSLKFATYGLKNEMIEFCSDKAFLKESDWKICDRENVYDALCKCGIEPQKAFEFMADLTVGRLDNEKTVQKWSDLFAKINASGAPEWYEKHIKTVLGLTSRANSAECVMTALSLLRYKTDYPDLFMETWMEAHKDRLKIDEKSLRNKDYKKYLEDFIKDVKYLESTDDYNLKNE